jgi:hypothetical protein
VAASTLEPLDALGVTRNLSPTRRNGLAAVRKAIAAFAQGVQARTSATGEAAEGEAAEGEAGAEPWRNQ